MDVEIWRSVPVNGSVDRLLIQGDALSVEVDGETHVRPVREWFALAQGEAVKPVTVHQTVSIDQKIACLEGLVKIQSEVTRILVQIMASGQVVER